MRKVTFEKPCLILVMGVAGSGKSTLSQEILRRLQAVYLDNNHIADAFFPQSRNGHSYDELRPRFYQALYRIAEENLKVGNSVLLDVPHVKDVQQQAWRSFITQLTKRSGAEMGIVRCCCSERVLRERLQSRGEARDRWKLENWTTFLTNEPVKVAMPFPHIDIDTEYDVEKNAIAAVKYLQDQSGRESGNAFVRSGNPVTGLISSKKL